MSDINEQPRFATAHVFITKARTGRQVDRVRQGWLFCRRLYLSDGTDLEVDYRDSTPNTVSNPPEMSRAAWAGILSTIRGRFE